ncbi:tetratricopeptide repeat-containing sensor histidine kinase [Flavobacterium pallidum]|uniref:Oxygen sensor histidine kinase NreB n=1 Tax=Flavobacterium pallidum TaxID=2172098 RepID=A0A2S1SEV5_9FLAO|nr:sensor histidine kinase [Flavobacterium pallidum]AWI24928.1 hypothetical protein HYN49_02905 [Flavobacterium pallidum]
MSYFRYLLIVLLLLLACSCQQKKLPKQTALADSLDRWFKIANNDSVAVATRKFYTDKAFAVVSKYPNNLESRTYYFKIAARYYNINALENYKIVTKRIIYNSKIKNDTTNIAEGYSFLGDYFNRKLAFDSAYINYDKSESFYIMSQDYSNAAKNIIYQARVQFIEKDYVGSEKSLFGALKFLKKTHHKELTYDAFNMLGVIYAELNEYHKSLEYHNRALKLLEDRIAFPKKEIYISSSLNNIGLVYQNKGDHKTAISYFKKALAYKDLFKVDCWTYALLINNLGYSELKMGKFNQLPKLFYMSLQISDSLGLVTSKISSKLHLSEYYALMNDSLKAYEFGFEALTDSKQNKLSKQILLSLKQMSIIDYKNKVSYFEDYIQISDSLQLAERQIRNNLGRVEYETDELATEKATLLNQRKTIIYIALTIILIAILISIIRIQSSKNRELRLVQQKQHANEEIYRLMLDQQQQRDEGRRQEKKRIARELHDGVMGQLTAIRLNLFALSRKHDPETIQNALGHIDKIQDVEKEIRGIAYDLTATIDEGTDYMEVITNIFSGLEQHSSIRFSMQVKGETDWNKVSVEVKIALCRMLQEALQNIIKYAQAENVSLTTRGEQHRLFITVQDDGVGFDLKKVRKGLGLRNMQERAREIGGSITITTAPGNGTSLEFTLPLQGNL